MNIAVPVHPTVSRVSVGTIVTDDMVPARYVEYIFYFMVMYSTVGSPLGISLPVPAAGILAVLAVICFARLQSRALAVYSPVLPLLMCGATYLLVQLLVHDESIMGEYLRPFVSWIPMIVICQSLAFRQGFLHRFALATFIVGLMTLPFLTFDEIGGGRARLDAASSIGNPNDLAAWFGFCAVYFLTTAIESRRDAVRVTAFLFLIGCLGVVGVTVSRTTLVAVALAAVVALRHVLRAGLLPVLLFVVLCAGALQTTAFENAVSSYTARGLRDTGRLEVWPLAIERVVESPLLGVGASDSGTEVTGSQVISPHNGFLFLALASGIVPFVLFARYWWRAARTVWRSRGRASGDMAYALPLFAYAFVSIQSGNLIFLAPWVVATTAVVMWLPNVRRSIEPVTRGHPVARRIQRPAIRG